MDTMTARDHLDWATQRALEYFDAGDKTNAFASFFSDVTKHDGTAWIATHSSTMMLLELGWSGGRSEFKRMMEGFAASDQPSGPRTMPVAPVNTATEDVALQSLFGTLAGGTPGDSIVAQERAGQSSFVNSDTLPRDMSDEDKLALETAGVVFGDPVPGDDLFVYVTLPEGWHRQGTSHDMHSDLLDEKGRRRAGIFYKAAFYDRRADMHIVPRFSIRTDYETPKGTITKHAMDGNEVVFTATESYEGEEYGDNYNLVTAVVSTLCDAWFRENGFPEWRNASMYWD